MQKLLKHPLYVVALGMAGFAQFCPAASIFSINDPIEFNKIIDTNSVLVTNAFLDTWIEGPVWMPQNGGFLIFSEVANNKLRKLVPPSTVTDYYTPAANTKCNGNMLDAQERLITCQAGSAALRVAFVTNSVATPLVTQYTNGLKFYSPNDLAIKSDGSIWFTDPGYDSGLPLPPPYGGSVPSGFQPGLYVYRFYQSNGNATVLQVITNMSRPNGICLSPDEKKLYVADTANTPGIIKAFNLTSSNTVQTGSTFCTVQSGVPDGIKCDVDGRVWSSAGDGVEIFAPDGHLIGKILLTRVANLCFGGPQYKILYTVGQPYVSSITVRVAGSNSIRRLGFSKAGGDLKLSWPAPSTGFSLYESAGLSGGNTWSNVASTPVAANGFNEVSVPATNSQRYYRLRLN
jgi:gluconolactonase